MPPNKQTLTIDTVIELLPESIRELATVVGTSRAILIALAYQYRDLYVPMHLNEHYEIVKLLGMETASLLHKHYAGERLRLAMCASLIINKRNESIARLLSLRVSPSVVAKFFGITQSLVYKVAAGKGISLKRRRAGV